VARKAKEAKLVPALVSGIRILRHLNASREPMGVAQIAQDLALNASTCFNLLRTLAHERLVVFDPASKKYVSGLGLLELANGALRNADYLPQVHQHLERIAGDHGVTALLWQRVSENRFVVVDKAEAPTAVRVHLTIGQRLPALIGAFGRCVAAQSGHGKDRLRALFAELRWQNAPTFESYWRDVEEARQRGYAVDTGNYHAGVTTVAASIADRNGVAVMAISAIALSTQLTAARVPGVAKDIAAAATELEAALRGGPVRSAKAVVG
jgi:DNA-binding IclR family transcriptional regulator